MRASVSSTREPMKPESRLSSEQGLASAVNLACSLFAAYDMTIRRRLNVLYSIAFAVVLSVTAYVIIDLEYPRLGLIQVSDSDQVLVDLRKSMN